MGFPGGTWGDRGGPELWGAGGGVAEETQPQATEIRRRTQELLRVMQRARGAAPAAPGARPAFSPRDFWRAVRNACPAFDNTRQHDAGRLQNGRLDYDVAL